MAELPRVQLTHMGLRVHDIDKMVAFYTRFFGFHVADRGETRGHRVAFLTLDPNSHHQIVMEDGRPEKIDFNNIQQISFKTDGLASVRAYWKALQTEAVTDIRPITHGNAWSVYFQDPEDNRTEIYCDTPWHVAQPFGVPIDYSLPEPEILRFTQELIRDKPTYSSFEEFRRTTATKLDAKLAPAPAK
jgi:catechol 2,3-dioxygenase-like lactoylglutathione lyase family enzyme